MWPSWDCPVGIYFQPFIASSPRQQVIRQEWRIKCIWVHHAPPESRDAGGGSLFLGLATGLVLTYPITDAV